MVLLPLWVLRRGWGGRPGSDHLPTPLQEFVWEASHYLVRQVFNSLQEMFSGTRAIQVCGPGPSPRPAGRPRLGPALSPSCPASTALADRERPAHRPHGLGRAVGHTPGHPHHPALPPGCQGVGTCAPPRPPRCLRVGLLTLPPPTMQIAGGMQSLTFSQSGDTSQ